MSKEGVSRRRFLTVAGTAAGAVAVSQLPFAKARTGPPRFTGYPFTLGVASGDPTPDGVVLWTRLAPVAAGPAAAGCRTRRSRSQWELAKDEQFTQVVARGEEQARADRGALGPCRADGAAGRATSTSTASRPTGRSARSDARRRRRAGATSALAFAFASCQQYEHGYYTAYKHMAQEDLDLVIHVGDYIYEYDSGSYTSTGGNVRGNSNHEIVNLARLPRAPRAVQDRPGPAGRARRVPVAGDLRRPRGRQQLGRRDPRGGDAARLLHAPPHAPPSAPTGSTCRCARRTARRARTSRSTAARSTATWRRST